MAPREGGDTYVLRKTQGDRKGVLKNEGENHTIIGMRGYMNGSASATSEHG